MTQTRFQQLQTTVFFIPIQNITWKKHIKEHIKYNAFKYIDTSMDVNNTSRLKGFAEATKNEI